MPFLLFNIIKHISPNPEATGDLSTLVTSVVLYSLTRATMMSPGQDETRVCVETYIYIYISSVAGDLIWTMGFEPTTTEFRSDAINDWAIRPWVQLVFRLKTTYLELKVSCNQPSAK